MADPSLALRRVMMAVPVALRVDLLVDVAPLDGALPPAVAAMVDVSPIPGIDRIFSEFSAV